MSIHEQRIAVSLANDEQVSKWLGVEHWPVKGMPLFDPESLGRGRVLSENKVCLSYDFGISGKGEFGLFTLHRDCTPDTQATSGTYN